VTFHANTETLWLLLLVLLVILMKVAIKVVRILLRLEDVEFDIRQLPEFVASDVLFDIGGLLILALPTFLKPTELPQEFAKELVALQWLFRFVALSMIGKHAAKIRDYFPSVPKEEGATVPDPAPPKPESVPPDPGSSQPTNPPVPG